MILLDAGEFRAAQAARATNLDSFSSEIPRGLERFFHGATERNAALELQGDIFGHELGVGFRRLDLDDVDVNFFASHATKLFLELVDFSAFAPDDNAWASGGDSDTAAACRALDQNLRHGRRLELLLQKLADVAVFRQKFAEFLFAGVPLGT